MHLPLHTRALLQEAPGNPVSVFSFASLGTRQGGILLLSSANLLAPSPAKSVSGQKARLTQQFHVPLWFAVSKAVTHTRQRLFEVGLHMFP